MKAFLCKLLDALCALPPAPPGMTEEEACEFHLELLKTYQF